MKHSLKNLLTFQDKIKKLQTILNNFDETKNLNREAYSIYEKEYALYKEEYTLYKKEYNLYIEDKLRRL